MTTIAIASGVGIGLGAVSLVTGIVFLATGEDPDQFRLRVDDDVFALELRPAIDGGPRRGFVGVRARF